MNLISASELRPGMGVKAADIPGSDIDSLFAPTRCLKQVGSLMHTAESVAFDMADTTPNLELLCVDAPPVDPGLHRVRSHELRIGDWFTYDGWGLNARMVTKIAGDEVSAIGLGGAWREECVPIGMSNGFDYVALMPAPLLLPHRKILLAGNVWTLLDQSTWDAMRELGVQAVEQ